MKNMQIFIQNVEDGTLKEVSQIVNKLTWETTLEAQPGKVKMNMLQTDGIVIQEGDKVLIRDNDKPVFFGFVFTVGYNERRLLDVTVYDSMRYLKNVATYIFSGKTAAQIFAEICDDFNVKYSVVDDCTWVVSDRIHENKSMFDIIQFGLDECLINTDKWYIMRDNAGTIELVDLENLRTNWYIGDNNMLSQYDYETSIDKDTYNRVKLVKENKDTAKRDVYVVFDSANEKKWGTLQLYESVDDTLSYEQIRDKAMNLLRVKNRKTRRMKISVLVGTFDLRAGNGIVIDIADLKNTGFTGKQNFIIARCTHNIEENKHTMDLEILNRSLEANQETTGGE